MPHHAAPAPRSGLGVGAIVGIVLGVLVLLGGGAAVAGFVLLRGGGSSAARLSDAADNSALLQRKIEVLAAAVRTKDAAQVEGPLLELAILPDDARAWSMETFGPAKGPEMFEGWERNGFADLPDLVGKIREAEAKGRTKVRVTRIADPSNLPANQIRKNLFPSMVVRRALYRVEFLEPAEDIFSDDIEFFAVVNGQLGYVGNLVSAW